jgi:hypothetical protein
MNFWLFYIVLFILNVGLQSKTNGKYFYLLLGISAILLCIYPIAFVMIDNIYWHKNFYQISRGIIQSSFIYIGICVFMPFHIVLQIIALWYTSKIKNSLHL